MVADIQEEEHRNRPAAGPLPAKNQVVSQGTRFWRRFRRHRLAVGGAVFLVILALAGIFAPLITTDSPIAVHMDRPLHPPSLQHPLGTDTVGRDIWARIIFAIRVSLSIGLVSVSIAGIISIILGLLSGYYGGIVDMIIMRITDVIMSFPSLVIIITVVALVGPSIYNVMAVIGLLGWPSMTRLFRAQILSVRERDFVMAARCVGIPDWRIMLFHIMPSAIPPLIVAATFAVAGAILTEAGLSFLGLGVLPPTPSWGNMLNQARSISILTNQPWMWIPAGVMVLLTVLAINFVGDGLQDALDPRARE